jgi:hypothetical protein
MLLLITSLFKCIILHIVLYSIEITKMQTITQMVHNLRNSKILPIRYILSSYIIYKKLLYHNFFKNNLIWAYPVLGIYPNILKIIILLYSLFTLQYIGILARSNALLEYYYISDTSTNVFLMYIYTILLFTIYLFISSLVCNISFIIYFIVHYKEIFNSLYYKVSIINYNYVLTQFKLLNYGKIYRILQYINFFWFFTFLFSIETYIYTYITVKIIFTICTY